MSVDVVCLPLAPLSRGTKPYILQPVHTIASLDRRLQAYLFSFLHLEELVRVGATCRSFESLLGTHFTMAKICSSQRLLGLRCKHLVSVLSLLGNLVGENTLCSSLASIVEEVLEIATCQLMLTSRKIHTPTSPYLSTTEFFPNFSLLASVFSEELREATRVLTTATTNAQLLDNLEIVAFSLRRQAEQLKKMYFTHSFDTITRPALLIRESLGRKFWEREFGNDNCVPFSLFEEKLFVHWNIAKREEKESLNRVLSFLLNFPQDNLVTTYKWDAFLGQWGSFTNLLDNLRLVALQPGFLGVMNGKQAEMLLSSLPQGQEFALIRFSSSSKTLSIAYMSSSGVRHERKPPLVDLQQFLRRSLENRSLVPMTLRWDKISELQTLEDCVKLSSDCLIQK